MSAPGVGDIVMYHPGTEDALAHFGWPLAAIVVCVYDEGTVNLSVFDPEGVLWSRVNVHPKEEGDPPKDGHFEAKPSAQWFGGKQADRPAPEKQESETKRSPAKRK